MPRFGDYRRGYSSGNAGGGNSGYKRSGGTPMSGQLRRSDSQHRQQGDYAGQRAASNIQTELPSNSDVSVAQLRRNSNRRQQQYPMPPSPPPTPASCTQQRISASKSSRSGGAGRQAMLMHNDRMSSNSEELFRPFETMSKQEKQQHRPQQQQQQHTRKQQNGQELLSRSGGPNSRSSRCSIGQYSQQSIAEYLSGPKSIQSPPVHDTRHRSIEATPSDRRTTCNGRRRGTEDRRSFDGHCSRQRYRRPREITTNSDSFIASSSASSRCSSGPEGNEIDSGYAKESLASRPDTRSVRNRGDRRRQRQGCAAFPFDSDIFDDSVGHHQDRSHRRQCAPPSFRGNQRKPPPLSPPLDSSVNFNPRLEDGGRESGNNQRRSVNDYYKGNDGYSSSPPESAAPYSNNHSQRFAGWRETSQSEKTILSCPHVELVLMYRTYQCDRCDSCRKQSMKSIPSSSCRRDWCEPQPASTRTYLSELSDRIGVDSRTHKQPQQHLKDQHRGRQYPQDQLQPSQFHRSRQLQRQMTQSNDMYDPGGSSGGGVSDDGDSWRPSWKSCRKASTRGSRPQHQSPIDFFPRQEASSRQDRPYHYPRNDGRQASDYQRSSQRGV